MRALAALALVLAAAACTDPQPCPSPLEECGGQCVDVQSDRRFCGGCGVACGVGESCVAGVCDPDASAACPVRTGGAFVTLGSCGEAVKLWIESPDFIQEAKSASPRVPVLAIRTGSDCDAQWSWHVDGASASFAAAPPSGACNLCPHDVEADVVGGLPVAASWCPDPAAVLAVDER